MTGQNGSAVSGSFSATFDNEESPFSSHSIEFVDGRYQTLVVGDERRRLGVASLAQYVDGHHEIDVDEWNQTNLWFALFGNWDGKWQEASGKIHLDVSAGQKKFKGTFEMIITDGYPKPVNIAGDFEFNHA